MAPNNFRPLFHRVSVHLVAFYRRERRNAILAPSSSSLNETRSVAPVKYRSVGFGRWGFSKTHRSFFENFIGPPGPSRLAPRREILSGPTSDRSRTVTTALTSISRSPSFGVYLTLNGSTVLTKYGLRTVISLDRAAPKITERCSEA